MSAQYKDYYKTLGVPREASEAEIKKAFRKLARQHHPDVAEDKTGSEAKFKEINEAYEVLGDPEKRKRYDAMGANWDQQAGHGFGGPGGWGGGGPAEGFEFEFGGTGFSDFFERYFGGGRARQAGGFGGRPGGRSRAQRGNDIEGDIMVTLLEAMEGSLRTISLRHSDPATGQVSAQEVQVRIPPGITEGQRLRVPAHGGPGVGGGTAGDLFLRVRIATHPDFRIKGHDLYRDLPLAPWEAVLGATIPVTLPAGRSVQVRIPAGTQAGDQLRLGGYGLPKKGGPGDLYVVITLQVPTRPGGEERALWEKLGEISNFKPRES